MNAESDIYSGTHVATLYEGAIYGMTKNTVALLIDSGARYKTANA